MKDSAVPPAGYLHSKRVRQMLDALSQRAEHTQKTRLTLEVDLESQRVAERESLEAARSESLETCRLMRRKTLNQWDESEETLTAQYEKQSVIDHDRLNRLKAGMRREKADQLARVKNKFDTRMEEIHTEYETHKNQPAHRENKEKTALGQSLGQIQKDLETTRELTIRRLDQLPLLDLGNEHNPFQPDAPGSVKETLGNIQSLTKTGSEKLAELQSASASKLISIGLPLGTLAMIGIWIGIVTQTVQTSPLIWAAGGVPVALLIAFVIYLFLSFPLKRLTKELYPQIEQIALAADGVRKQGIEVAHKTRVAGEKALLDKKETQTKAAETWHAEQVSTIEKEMEAREIACRKEIVESIETTDHQFVDQLAQITQTMRAKAEAVAEEIQVRRKTVDEEFKAKVREGSAKRYQRWERLGKRFDNGIGSAAKMIQTAVRRVDDQFVDWNNIRYPHSIGTTNGVAAKIEFLPIGSLQVKSEFDGAWDSARQKSNTDSVGSNGQHHDESQSFAANPGQYPLVFHRRLHSAIVIHADPAQLDAAIEAMNSFLWRLLTSTSPGRAQLTLIDPVGRGQSFTPFMAIGDHSPAVVGGRVWTDDDRIEKRLLETATLVEDLLQSGLRDRYGRLEDYNLVAGSMGGPYRCVAAVGFPRGLNRSAYAHLMALIGSGRRCGVMTVIVSPTDQKWPMDMPCPAGDEVLEFSVDQDGVWKCLSSGWDDVNLEWHAGPSSGQRAQLAESIGAAAAAADRVVVPLEKILPLDTPSDGDSSGELSIPIGSQGGERTLQLSLGIGVAQHVLIAGKTGSGKSSLLHSLIVSGATIYSPEELHYYLLDFKKGVEFKAYADSGLPHARVIGIESEREFGLSVLRRLDEELQKRGERFRQAGVSDLASFRKASGEVMPRVLLVVDEFQEMFVRDDRMAADATMLLDRLVRQGRSFGMHVVLASQSLAGAYSLPRATLGQMAIRIAMQCGESDAAFILSDDNTAARLLTRPGEAIFNDAGGLIEGNQPLQVAYLDADELKGRVEAMANRHADLSLDPPVIFEGNRPGRWSPALIESVVRHAKEASPQGSTVFGLLGESVEIGPPTMIEFRRDGGRNTVLISPPSCRVSLMASILSAVAGQREDLTVHYFDGVRGDDADSLSPWLEQSSLNHTIHKVRDSEQDLIALAKSIPERSDEDPPKLVIVDPLERFREFRQDDSYSFSLDAAADSAASGAQALQTLLRDGPSVGVFTVLICGGAETLTRWLPRATMHDLEQKILGPMNASDSSQLIDSVAASELSEATMLIYDDSTGKLTKFRYCQLPTS